MHYSNLYIVYYFLFLDFGEPSFKVYLDVQISLHNLSGYPNPNPTAKIQTETASKFITI